jgi:hypothetical protein
MSAIAIPLDGVKGRQRKMWASGDYAAVAARIHPMTTSVDDTEQRTERASWTARFRAKQKRRPFATRMLLCAEGTPRP